MNNGTSKRSKRLAFGIVTSICVLVAFAYTLVPARNASLKDKTAASVPVDGATIPPASPEGVASQPPPQGNPELSPGGPSAPMVHTAALVPARRLGWFAALSWRDSPSLGIVEVANLDAVDHRTRVDLRCERMYFAAGSGICLTRKIEMFSAQTIATLVDAEFKPRFSVKTAGIPSRARLSPDGRYGAFTVFVTGHSYGASDLSTATILLDASKGSVIANLEDFRLWKDGRIIEAVDLNYWGVTFKKDSNFFYATLRTSGVNYLVHGDIGARTMEVVYAGVECPSLSPDETRIAFKRMVSRANWRLTVLDLSSFAETPLAEKASVDDQAEWLDNDHVLYEMLDESPWMSTMVVPADGTGQPSVFAKGVLSPAVIR